MRHFADLHIHLGSDSKGRPVKITASRSLTLGAALKECEERKGIDILGVVDCGSPGVIRDLMELVDSGRLSVMEGGGFRLAGGTVLIPGSELECPGPEGGSAHCICYFPDLAALEGWYGFLKDVVTNPTLSTQRARVGFREVFSACRSLRGEFVIAHAFTPHKSAYGSCVRRLRDMLGEDLPDLAAVELGLSSDSNLADTIAELADFTFLTNSDAHSAGKIAREYNVLDLPSPDFSTLFDNIRKPGGVTANYGLDPRLGKYHRTYCDACEYMAHEPPPVPVCPSCGSSRDTVMGVLDRITTIRDRSEPLHPDHRPPYIHHIPFEFIPGLGPKSAGRLIEAFGSEMSVIHDAGMEALTAMVGQKLAIRIDQARKGLIGVTEGGGGIYGRIIPG